MFINEANCNFNLCLSISNVSSFIKLGGLMLLFPSNDNWTSLIVVSTALNLNCFRSCVIESERKSRLFCLLAEGKVRTKNSCSGLSFSSWFIVRPGRNMAQKVWNFLSLLSFWQYDILKLDSRRSLNTESIQIATYLLVSYMTLAN